MSFALSFGYFFAPTPIEAGFLSSLLGTEVSASAETPTEPGNSQSIVLLESNISTLAMIDEKNTNPNGIKQDININIVSENALLPSVSPLSGNDSIGGGDFSFEGYENLNVYVVRSGDTIAGIAEIFGITPDTIYSFNDMRKGDKVKEGTVFLIPSFSGVEHTVAKGETLQGIANKYKVKIDDILLANDIESNAKIVIGEKLMIPGGELLAPAKLKTTASSSIARGSTVPVAAGYFKNPLPGWPKSRGITNKHRGVDLAAPTGTPIQAAAGGTVVIARNGYSSGFGNYVVIQHDNGTKTLYAHMSRLGTTPGAQVSKGEVIGYVGNTGRSRGAHLHFEVLNGKNPF